MESGKRSGVEPPAGPAWRRRAVQAALAVALAGVVVLRIPDPTSERLFDPALVGVFYVAAVTGELWRMDVVELRLPNKLVGPGYAFCAAGLATAWASSGAMPAVPVLAGSATFALLLLLHVAGGLGAGDVKLGGLLGSAAGTLGATPAVAAVVIAFLTGGAVAGALLVAGRTDSAARIPFGPFLLLGFWTSAAFVAG